MAAPDVYDALANDTRRAMLDLLRERPRSVNHLAEHFDIQRPSLSQHLRVLREAGLVTAERDGRQRVYRVQPEALAEVADWLAPYEAFWRGRLRELRHRMQPDDVTAPTTSTEDDHP